MLRLTKLLIKAVLALFYSKRGILQFIRALLSMQKLSTHQSLKRAAFGTALAIHYLPREMAALPPKGQAISWGKLLINSLRSQLTAGNSVTRILRGTFLLLCRMPLRPGFRLRKIR